IHGTTSAVSASTWFGRSTFINNMRLLAWMLSFGLMSLPALYGQSTSHQHDETVPIYKVTVVQRALEAVNFQRHSGPTHLDLKGTVLMAQAEGDAKVTVKNGYTAVDASFKHLEPPTQFGTEFLTYVLWAITPDGKSINLGE